MRLPNLNPRTVALALVAAFAAVTVPNVANARTVTPAQPATLRPVVSVASDARYLIGCLTLIDPTAPECGTRYDKAVARVAKATKGNAEVVRICRALKPKTSFAKGWKVGYCQMVQDDSTNTRLAASNLGIIARTRLVA